MGRGTRKRQRAKHGHGQPGFTCVAVEGSDSEPELPQSPQDHTEVPLQSRGERGQRDHPESEAAMGSEDVAKDIVNVEFEINALKDSDFHGVKCLLQQLFWRDMNEHLSQWTDVILSQWEYVGSAITVKDSDDVYGVISCINLHHHKDLACVKELKHYLLRKCTAAAPKLTEVFNDESKGVGLIINERFMNLPFHLVQPMHSILHEEINSAVVEDHQPFAFDNYLVMAKTYRTTESNAAAAAAADRKKGKKRKKRRSSPVNYVNPEEELFCEAATVCDHFNVDHSSNDAAKAVIMDDSFVLMGRQVLLVPAQKIPSLIARMALMADA